ncbi:hypothetical protein AB0B66_10540 [Catellatospora sp. NPDC049111]|uniref:hypothetical protein n=1 Tax=Catellatospora sp. NPDC049111 TaxID=3155271 RepID=UPI0034020632
MTTEQTHPDTLIVDQLTAFLNRSVDPSGGDVVDLLTSLVCDSGRPLLNHTIELDAEVVEDRYGIATAVVYAGPYTIRITQPADGHADIVVAVTTDDHDDYGLAITVDRRPVLDAMPNTWTSSVPADLQLAPPAVPRHTISRRPR